MTKPEIDKAVFALNLELLTHELLTIEQRNPVKSEIAIIDDIISIS